MNKQSELKFGVLTGEEIRDLKIIDPSLEIDLRCFSNASVDLRLGEKYFFPHLYQKAISQRKDSRLLTESEQSELLDNQIYNCATEGYLSIPKFTSVVIETYESLIIPDNIAGRFDLRIKWAIAGLVLQVGTQIEPGYKGKLWGLLHNFSNEEVTISYKSYEHRLLTAEFSFTNKDTPPLPSKKPQASSLKSFLLKYQVKSGSLSNYFEEIENTKKGIQASVKRALGTIHTEVKAKLDEIEQIRANIEITRNQVDITNNRINDKNNFRTSIFLLIGTFIVSVTLPVVITKFTFDKDDYLLFDQTKILKEQIDLMKKDFNTKLSNRDRSIDSLKLTLEKNKPKRKKS
jgi:deoxycytidine triphosphate deaminase